MMEHVLRLKDLDQFFFVYLCRIVFSWWPILFVYFSLTPNCIWSRRLLNYCGPRTKRSFQDVKGKLIQFLIETPNIKAHTQGTILAIRLKCDLYIQTSRWAMPLVIYMQCRDQCGLNIFNCTLKFCADTFSDFDSH